MNLPKEVIEAINREKGKLTDAASEEMIDVAEERFHPGTYAVVNNTPQAAWAIHEDGFERGMIEGARIALEAMQLPQTSGGNGLMYEDELPQEMPKEDYDKLFEQSQVVDGVRMGPRYSLPKPSGGQLYEEMVAALRARHPDHLPGNEELEDVEACASVATRHIEAERATREADYERERQARMVENCDLRNENERLLNLVDRLRLQAQMQAQEMRTHKASLHECYQVASGATGEQGDWNGANPIREAIEAERSKVAALTAENERLREEILPTKEDVKAEALAIQKEMEKGSSEDVRQSFTARAMFLAGAWFARSWKKSLSEQPTQTK